jgi:hypothetical protein
MMTDAERQLHQALNGQKFDLEIEKAAASECGLEERIEATRRDFQTDSAYDCPVQVKVGQSWSWPESSGGSGGVFGAVSGLFGA